MNRIIGLSIFVVFLMSLCLFHAFAYADTDLGLAWDTNTTGRLPANYRVYEHFQVDCEGNVPKVDFSFDAFTLFPAIDQETHAIPDLTGVNTRTVLHDPAIDPTTLQLENKPDGLYRWAVTAEVEGLTSNYSEGVGVCLDSVAPNSPADFTYTVTGSTVTMSWTAPPDTDLVAFKIYEDTNVVAQVAGNATSYVLPNIIGTHSYTLVAVDQADNESQPAGPITVQVTVPDAPPTIIINNVQTVNITYPPAQ